MAKTIILNHKMNLEYDEVYEYIDRLNKVETKNNIIVCPSNIYLESFMNHCTWGVGSQNVFYETNGNYTGEISTLQLKSLGVEYVMVGHYERKKYFKETNEIINKKLNACIDANIMPILCFGESGAVDEAISSLDELLKGIEKIDFIIFAYEPLKVKDDEIKTIHDKINKIYDYLFNKYHSMPHIIYGGGIDKDNVNELFKCEKLSGILIDKISSDIKKCEKVINAID